MTFNLAKLLKPIADLFKKPLDAAPAEDMTPPPPAEDAGRPLVQAGIGKYAKQIPLKPGVEIEIGRCLGSAITSSRPRYELTNAAVSAKHAHIGVDEGGIYILDVGTEGAGSRNGTFVNASKLAPLVKTYLKASDEVWLGKPYGPMSVKLIVLGDQIGDTAAVSFPVFAAR